MNEQTKLSESYKEKIWIYNKKPIKLGDMQEYQLEQCMKFLNYSNKRRIFGDKKNNWKEAINFLIKNKSYENVIYIVNQRRIHKVNRLNKLIDKVTLNKVQTLKVIK